MPEWSLKRNKQLGIIYHKETGFVVKSEKVAEKRTVIGVLVEEDEEKYVRELTKKDIELIKASEFNLQYEEPNEQEQEDDQERTSETNSTQSSFSSEEVKNPNPTPTSESEPTPEPDFIPEPETKPELELEVEKEIKVELHQIPQSESNEEVDNDHQEFVQVSHPEPVLQTCFVLQSQLETLLKNYNSLLNENQTLKAELVSTKSQLETMDSKFKALKQLFN